MYVYVFAYVYVYVYVYVYAYVYAYEYAYAYADVDWALQRQSWEPQGLLLSAPEYRGPDSSKGVLGYVMVYRTGIYWFRCIGTPVEICCSSNSDLYVTPYNRFLHGRQLRLFTESAGFDMAYQYHSLGVPSDAWHSIPPKPYSNC